MVVSTSWYPDTDDVRCQQMGEVATLTREAGHYMALVDGSKNPDVAAFLKACGTLVFAQREPGMASSRREAFAHAKEILLELPHIHQGRRIVFWTEEKPYIVEKIPAIIEPLLCGSAEACIAKRSQSSFRTWPWFQAESEQGANAAYNEATGRNSDPMHGPVAVLIEFADVLINCYPERYGVLPFAAGYIQHFALMEMMASGCIVADSEPLDVIYPPLQKMKEETALLDAMLEKRRQQKEELSESYRIAARTLGINSTT
ncbi:MAG: hypothetical protein A3J10_02240 [Candidatus Sungbacteria bacterium RIFCSPLOWO2_02_FULL_54_10]|uniref:Uncharacterized protein n=2 Tax=Candidatus Sungiibacteriota TaxID=1817917 RepID=A0A1G2KX77_9BACT|nr:MAG: hypothetical protein A2679_03570 [Candidatus Sungbacteria bacterium RIFCSPHIGHO2_01_FULL_54_26]OHA04018.1 MAG: hypothetical protein A3C92_03695 [Candidatus Sungbacteria bacterium RIFCSPHIGHO2_02_FULL_53_17]OHA14049.1 MAG: hypothetical protein A3J10_02240 [Candidatus Sungbacteria bacterium RIFCSPLOWO2_02_FULL_54_10]